MHLSSAATSGTQPKHTMRLLGFIGKCQVLILIDSGSYSNFISEELATSLQCDIVDLPPAIVTLANGTKMFFRNGSIMPRPLHQNDAHGFIY
jgi:hypothetical protein